MASPSVAEDDNPAPERVALSKFAEYQDSAPEHTTSSRVVEHENPAPERAKLFAEEQDSAPQLGYAEQHNPAPQVIPPSEKEVSALDDNGTKKRRAFLGLALRTALILALVILLFVVGIVLGAVLGTRHTASPAGSSAPSATPTALVIKSAVYAAQDVTDKVRGFIPRSPNLVLNMTNEHTAWNDPDPWPNVRKCLAVLHSFGTSIRTFVACDAYGVFTLVPGNVSDSPRTQEITGYPSRLSNFSIVSVVWGDTEIRDKTVYSSLYDYKSNGSAVPFDNGFFGVDTLPDYNNTGVVWYTENDFSTFKSIFTREGSSVAF